MAILPRIKKLNRDDETDTLNEKQVKKKKIIPNQGKNCEKKVKKTNTWKNNVAAIARQRGETYTNQRGKKIPRKSVNLGTLCNEGCKKKCSEKVRPEER